MPPDSASRDLLASIERTLHEEARRNETRIADVRAFVLALTATLDYVVYRYPQATLGLPSFSPFNAAHAAGWFGVAAILAFALRRGLYRPWLRIALPAMDALLIFVLFATTWSTQRTVESMVSGAVVNVAAVCALFAATGGLRLTRTAALVTTALALADFGAIALVIGYAPGRAAFVGATVAATGLLGVWMTGIVRRAVASEVGRSTLARFLPQEVIDGAHDDPLRLLTEPRTVDATVVVTDLRGFTSLAETLAPGEVLELLSGFHGRLATVVRDHQGWVDKFMGDGMLAVFGAPQPLADHAARALAAAVALLRAVDTLNASRAGRGDVALRIGIGIHSGALVVGCLGAGPRLEFTVIGDTVNTAARLEAMTKDLGVDLLVSDDTLRRVAAGAAGRNLALARVGELAIRGRRTLLQVHTLDESSRVVSGHQLPGSPAPSARPEA